MKGIMVLEDGSHFEGVSIGVEGEKIGEVVLNTAVIGYQEIMTDPANAGFGFNMPGRETDRIAGMPCELGVDCSYTKDWPPLR